MISYAQNFEDVYLARAFRGQNAGTYVDVGAWDPVLDSVTKHFYDLGWSGVNVEPLPQLHRAFLERRPRDTNIRAVVSDRRGRATLYHVATSPGLSTMRAEVASLWRERGHAVEELEVPVWTLDDVYVMAGLDRVDFLKVDVEGAEREVLAGASWDRVRPRLVLVEATSPGSPDPAWDAWEPLLLASGYRCLFFDGLNRYYAPETDHGMDQAFRLPPNVWDGIVPYAAVRAQAEARSQADRTREMEARMRDLLARCHYLDDGWTLGAGAYRGLYRYRWGEELSFGPGGAGWAHALYGLEPAGPAAAVRGCEAGLLFEADAAGDLAVDVRVEADRGASGAQADLYVNGLRVGTVRSGEPAAIVPRPVWALRPVVELRIAPRDDQVTIVSVTVGPRADAGAAAGISVEEAHGQPS